MTLNHGPIIRAPLARGYDGVVAITGRADFSTIQAADDVLDAAAYSLYVKQGTYAAGFTVSTNNAYIFVEPGTVIQAAIVLSGTGITLVLGAQCDVQGLITLSGNNCSLICQGGVDIDGILVSGNTCLVDGGGWDTLSDGGTVREGIDLTGDDVICQNIACQTTAGGGNNLDAMETSGARNIIRNVKVIDSDEIGISASGVGARIEGCQILGCDGRGITIASSEISLIGNRLVDVGDIGILVDNSGENAVIVGNIVKGQASSRDAIYVDAAGENCVIVGNRVDDLGTTNGIDDDSGTSTVTGNDETAF
jgi:hypothetical protein